MKFPTFFLILVALFTALVSASPPPAERTAVYDFQIHNQLEDDKPVSISCKWEPMGGNAFTGTVPHKDYKGWKLEAKEVQHKDGVYRCTWKIEGGHPSEGSFDALRPKGIHATTFEEGVDNSLKFTFKQEKKGGKIYAFPHYKWLDVKIINNLKDPKTIEISCHGDDQLQLQGGSLSASIRPGRSMEYNWEISEDREAAIYRCQSTIKGGRPPVIHFDVFPGTSRNGTVNTLAYTFKQSELGGKIDLSREARMT